MDEKKELKKCPLCGGEAEIVEDKNHVSFIRCKKLCCRTCFFESPQEAIEAWNRRGGRMSIENVNHPSHYNDGKIEVIDYIEDKKLGFHLGNAIKYISRAGKKDKDKAQEDIEKAIWYLERYLEVTKK